MTTLIKPTTSSALINRQDREVEIGKIVVEVELAKHLREKMAPQQRAALIRAIADQPWSVADVRRRGQAVMKKETYGRIGFDCWHNAEETFTVEEMEKRARQIAEHLIKARKKALEDGQPAMDPEARALMLEVLGMEPIAAIYERRFREQEEAILDQEITRARDVEAAIKRLSPERKKQLARMVDRMDRNGLDPWHRALLRHWEIAKKRPVQLTGEFEKDPHAGGFLHLIAPLVMDQVEKWMVEDSR